MPAVERMVGGMMASLSLSSSGKAEEEDAAGEYNASNTSADGAPDMGLNEDGVAAEEAEEETASLLAAGADGGGGEAAEVEAGTKTEEGAAGSDVAGAAAS